ncbi:hypothetical protein GIB67_000429 [Kingdonia uniflora]|uniref:Signal recognition particle subunit SRP72 n=1 Tax=Kingdonia uniflora TaxID=39325 RepID=A0A7J7MPM6_9MAGN|nr:hypothetical protein GIB67_000429 [Kingdonia uniflora]
MAPKTKEKPKPSTTPQPSQPPIVTLEDLFTSLNRHIQRSEYQQAVKLADQVLKLAPRDEDALRCKIVGLIKADNLDEALSAIRALEKIPRDQSFTVDFSFDKAYCLYRQNKLDEALESLKSIEKTSAVMQLESQILYRLGRMEACMDVYQKLQKFKIESLEINVVAGLISAGRALEVQSTIDALKVKANSSFELAYNTACSLIEQKKFADAEQHLLSARRIGQETLMEDNWADDEIENELAPIAVQLAYVRQQLGLPQEALEAYLNIITRNLADDSSLAVATNNLITLRGPKEVSDGLRKLDKLTEKGDGGQSFQLARGLDLKLSSKQREAIYSNRALLLLHANRIDQARELVTALQDMFPGNITPPLLQAAVLVRENKVGRAEEILQQFANKFPEISKTVLLARAQVAATANHHQIAAETLAKIPDIQNMPATVATLVALKERAGDIEGASKVLDTALGWWSNSMTEDNKLDMIMNESASFKLKHGREEEAAKLYETLVKSHGNVEALVGLVTTAANVDIEKAEAYEKKLKPLLGLKGVNVEGLEKTSGAMSVQDGGQMRNVEIFEEGKGKSKEKKKKRKRKPKYPKGFDPANPGPPPDLERWLPKRERSSYRPKRKDKRAAQVRGSQGTVVRDKHEASTTSTNVSISRSNEPAATTSKPASKPDKKSSRKKSRN